MIGTICFLILIIVGVWYFVETCGDIIGAVKNNKKNKEFENNIRERNKDLEGII